MKFDGWRGEWSGQPRTTGKLRRWFKTSLLHAFQNPGKIKFPRMSYAEALELAAWMCEQVMVYVTWTPADEYFGGKFPSGSYQVEWGAVVRDVPEGLELIRRDAIVVSGEGAESLEDWLRADMEGTAPRGPAGGSARLQNVVRCTLNYQAKRRRGCWPRACAACGEPFKPTRRNRRRCDACIAQGREQCDTA